MRDHVVVVGLGEKGLALSLAFGASPEDIVALDRDSSNPAIARCREHDVRVLVGDAADPPTLAHARVDRAKAVFVLAGTDEIATELGFAVERMASGRADRGWHRRRLPVFIEVENIERWRHLNALAIHRVSEGPGLEFFNVGERAAAQLVSQDWLRRMVQSAEDLAVIGSGGLVRSIGSAMLLAFAPGDEGKPARLEIVGPQAKREVAQIKPPETAAALAVQATDSDLDPARVVQALRGQEGSTKLALICVSGPAEALSLSGALRGEWPNEDDLRIVAVLPSAGAPAKEMLSAIAGVRFFGAWEAALAPDLLEQSSVELLARANHDTYRESQLALGETPSENPSLVRWEELPESLRESNRMFAESIGPKLAELGCVLVPSGITTTDAEPVLTSAEVDGLARLEHERWVNDLEADGWTYGPSKDPQEKVHPSLCPWSELPESEREKDRVLVAALPKVLAEMGFGIRRVALPGSRQTTQELG